MRPDVGTQPEFRKTRPPAKYRYDDSLSPVLEWDGQNAARDRAEALIEKVLAAETIEDARAAARELRAMSRPFLNWAGKAERLSFDVPTLPLFVHERLSTKAILETLQGHRRDKQMDLDLFGDPRHSIADQVLRAYEHRDQWVNRMILGDSLVVMNSLLHYENLGGQVQMVYMDPPYGVRFGSNFQPFVRKRDVKDNDDADMTREPEMVQAYRDTWQLGIHSYLTYLRDRLLLARELLSPTGSIFVQISDENLHHVRELMDEVFGLGAFKVLICYRRLGTMVGSDIVSAAHYLLWYNATPGTAAVAKIFEAQSAGVGIGDHYNTIENASTGQTRRLGPAEIGNVPDGWRALQTTSLQTHGLGSTGKEPLTLRGETFSPGPRKAWRTTPEGMERLRDAGRIVKAGRTLRYKQYLGAR
jgi:adenine-specific DNA-methyltransferase